MRINHNIAAFNAQNKLTVNENKVKKSMEKLSSGLRINRAGDDASGLAISEKMRGQIRGLEQALTNSQDGISLIQTGEGALNEIHAILQRQRELVVQASNDTNTEEERKVIKEEVLQLSDEINYISSSTEFNSHSLLNGKYSGKIQVGANEGQTIDLSIGNVNGASLGLVGGATISAQITAFPHGLSEGTYTIKNDKVIDAQGNEIGHINPTQRNEIVIRNGINCTVSREFSDGETFVYKTDANSTAMIKIPLQVNPDAVNASKLPAGSYYCHADKLYTDPDGIEVGTIDKGILTMSDKNRTKVNLKASFNLTDQDLKPFNGFDIRGLNVNNAADAADSLTILDQAIDRVSSQRAKLGAIQNRLEHTINNLSTSGENLTAAESRIRDIDMAKEMMEMTKTNILQQASQSMLAQANQSPQNVLQLLR